jgi:hypothetical protein
MENILDYAKTIQTNRQTKLPIEKLTVKNTDVKNATRFSDLLAIGEEIGIGRLTEIEAPAILGYEVIEAEVGDCIRYLN